MCMIALGLIGAGIQAAGMIAQGRNAQTMAEYQARAYEQQAQADSQAAGYEMQRERHRQDLLAASARAQAGASGVALQGSPTEVLAANARQGELDIQAIRYGSQLRQNQLRTQAGIARFEGRQARTASYFGAAGAVAGGLANAYSRSVQFGQSAFSRDQWKGLR